MKSNELSLNRLTEGQSVPRPHFGDASIVFDSDGVFKYIDGDDGAMKLIYPPLDDLSFFSGARFRVQANLNNETQINVASYGSILDLTNFGQSLQTFNLASGGTTPGLVSITKINGASKLVNIEDYGTAPAFRLLTGLLSAQEINKFFTELPPTTKTATLDLRYNTGSATCAPSIATAKGYIVTV